MYVSTSATLRTISNLPAGTFFGERRNTQKTEQAAMSFEIRAALSDFSGFTAQAGVLAITLTFLALVSDAAPLLLVVIDVGRKARSACSVHALAPCPSSLPLPSVGPSGYHHGIPRPQGFMDSLSLPQVWSPRAHWACDR